MTVRKLPAGHGLDSRVDVVATGVGFCEGPTLTQAGEVLCVSWDLSVLFRVTPGGVTTIAGLGGGPNGATEGPDGRIYIAQSGGHAAAFRPRFRFGMSGGIQVVGGGGEVTWLTMDPVRPNDLCFGPDGALWVTDPHQSRRDDGRLWRIDPTTGVGDLLVTVPWYTNGIAFGPEDDAVYVADTYASRIVRFPIEGDGLGKPETYVQLDRNHPDGFAFDVEGNLVVGAVSLTEAPGEVQVWDPEGELVDRLVPGHGTHFTNVALSPVRTLYITDSSNARVLAVRDWPTAGLPLHPFR